MGLCELRTNEENVSMEKKFDIGAWTIGQYRLFLGERKKRLNFHLPHSRSKYRVMTEMKAMKRMMVAIPNGRTQTVYLRNPIRRPRAILGAGNMDDELLLLSLRRVGSDQLN